MLGKKTGVNPYKSWMGDNFDLLKNHKLSDLCLPGTHDSGTSKVNFWVNLESKSSDPNKKVSLVGEFFRKIGHFFRSLVLTLVGKIVKAWVRTQSKTIKEQLESGVRALDLRISYNKDDKENPFYISHRFACVPLAETLQQIKLFMEENPKEVLIIKMTPDYDNRDGMLHHQKELLEQTINKLSGLLCKRRGNFNDDALTLDKMVDQKERVVLFYSKTGDVNFDYPPDIWLGEQCNGSWLNKTKAEDWERSFDDFKKAAVTDYVGLKHKCNTCDAVLTPDTGYVVKNFWRQLVPGAHEHGLKYMANKMQEPVLNVVSSSSDPKNSYKPNIVYTDFVTNVTVDKIVEYNRDFSNCTKTNLASESFSTEEVPTNLRDNTVKNATTQEYKGEMDRFKSWPFLKSLGTRTRKGNDNKKNEDKEVVVNREDQTHGM